MKMYDVPFHKETVISLTLTSQHTGWCHDQEHVRPPSSFCSEELCYRETDENKGCRMDMLEVIFLKTVPIGSVPSGSTPFI